MSTHFNSREYRTVTPVTIMPPKPAQVSPAIAARMQELALRMAPLMNGGMDFDTAYAQAFCELAKPKRAAERGGNGGRNDLPQSLIDSVLGDTGKTPENIRRVLVEWNMPTGHRAISRALRAGVESGRLVAEPKGKTVIYRRVS